MHKDGLMVGLVAVVYEPGDSAAFINVLGDLDLATLLGLAGEFDLDDLDDIMDDGHLREDPQPLLGQKMRQGVQLGVDGVDDPADTGSLPIPSGSIWI